MKTTYHYIKPRMPKKKIGLSAKAVKSAAEKRSADKNKSRVDRRRIVRMAIHLNKCIDYAFQARKAARKLNKLDDIQHLTEIIAYNKQALAHLNVISKHHFLKPLEQLMRSYR